MSEFRMPSLGADMEKGTLAIWHISAGQAVEKGDIVADVETDKGTIEVEIFESGIITEILVKEGQEVPVGTPLAQIQSATATATGDASKEVSGQEKLASVQAPGDGVLALQNNAEKVCVKKDEIDGLDGIRLPEKKAIVREPAHLRAGPARAGRLRVTPLARKIAEELGVNLALLHGSGIDGAITRADVLQARDLAASASRSQSQSQTANELVQKKISMKSQGMRQAIARAMTKSKKEIPHYYLQTEIDMERTLAWMEQYNREVSVKERLLVGVLLVKAVALAMNKFPELNGFYIDDEFHPADGVHVGFAISLRQGGLIAPAMHDCDKKPLLELMPDFLDLVNRTKSGKLRSSEISDATVTITSLGDRGVETVFGVIYPPQVALVGFGAITERPWAESGMLGVRRIMTATLSADHRASNGHCGGLFLSELKTIFSQPYLFKE